MARYCTHCGNEVNENAFVCLKCGCAIPQFNTYTNSYTTNPYATNPMTSASVVDVISQRIRTNGIIWIVIAVIQILLGITVDWFLLIVGVLNIVSAMQDLNYSQSFPQNPVGIVEKMKPLAWPIVTLVYNLIFGGVIGVAGSIYYLVAVRGYVLENEQIFLDIEHRVAH